MNMLPEVSFICSGHVRFHLTYFFTQRLHKHVDLLYQCSFFQNEVILLQFNELDRITHA